MFPTKFQVNWPFSFNPSSTEGSRRNLKKIGPGVSEEKLFNGVDEWTTDEE